MLFGMLSRDPQGRLCLEDGEGRVVLDMEDAVCDHSDLRPIRRIVADDTGTWRRALYGGMYGLD